MISGIVHSAVSFECSRKEQLIGSNGLTITEEVTETVDFNVPLNAYEMIFVTRDRRNAESVNVFLLLLSGSLDLICFDNGCNYSLSEKNVQKCRTIERFSVYAGKHRFSIDGKCHKLSLEKNDVCLRQ
ncbi:hypothetical protein NPIL_672691 [Nephila pilipes]|uniref:Uncharacterized protein n=1 Tax=Nephila pilipes TaxID=299642 RepID=A0A8X6N8M1_NEPPI|nr:hypothetical protein NPIL_672691 [Nephila pilipes]